MTEWHIGPLGLTGIPRVVGTASNFATLQSLLARDATLCDLVEVRLDLIGPDHADWLARCRSLEADGLPVILTLRSATEGGCWSRSDRERWPFLEAALGGLAAVDVEAASALCPTVCAMAAALGKTVIVSSHDFHGTPPLDRLRRQVDDVRKHENAVPKIAAMVQGEADIEVLAALIDETKGAPICVIGMGRAGAATRATFAALGSCLTYGYLDESSAPGQWPASELVQKLNELLPAYNQDAAMRRRQMESA